MRPWLTVCVALTVALPAMAQPLKPYIDQGAESRRAREREGRREAPKHQHHREADHLRSAPLPPRRAETRPAPPPQGRDTHRYREPPKPPQQSARPGAPRPYIDEKVEIRRARERDAQRYREAAPRPIERESAQAPRARSVTCRAAPVCTQSGRSCRPVEWVYSGTEMAYYRRDIARLCEVANTPDGCGCVSQCARTVSCSF